MQNHTKTLRSVCAHKICYVHKVHEGMPKPLVHAKSCKKNGARVQEEICRCMLACIQIPPVHIGVQNHRVGVQMQTSCSVHISGGRGALHTATGDGGQEATDQPRREQHRPPDRRRPPAPLQRGHLPPHHHPRRLPGPRLRVGWQLQRGPR